MSKLQQPEYSDTKAEEVIAAEVNIQEPGTLAKLPPADRSDNQLQRIGQQVAVFFAELPDYLGQFFNEYKQPFISVGLFVAAVITLKAVLSALDALNDIPLLKIVFEFVGIGYSAWFIYRYLLRASNRQELSEKLQMLKEQVIGRQLPPARNARQPRKGSSVTQTTDNQTPIIVQPASTPVTVSAAPESVPEVIRSQAEQASWAKAPREEAQQEKVIPGKDALIQPKELKPKVFTRIEPTLTEEKAIAQAVKNTLAATTPEESSEDQEGNAEELIRPHPPAPQLVEAAINDAEEKDLDFSPPEIVDTEGEAKSKR